MIELEYGGIFGDRFPSAAGVRILIIAGQMKLEFIMHISKRSIIITFGLVLIYTINYLLGVTTYL